MVIAVVARGVSPRCESLLRDSRIRLRLHQFRNDIGVEKDHRRGSALSKLGASRSFSRVSRSNSTPWSPLKSLRVLTS